MGDTGLTGLLFSGGMDSVALAHHRRPDRLILINYGQIVSSAEIKAARYFANELDLPLTELEADLRCTGAGSLAHADQEQTGHHPEWWPFRNQLLVSIGAAWGVTKGITRLLIGTVKSDSCFADGTERFLDAMNALLATQEGAMRLEAPAIGIDTSELIRVSAMPTRYLPMCFSCNVSIRPCGTCRSCIKHTEIMREFELSM